MRDGKVYRQNMFVAVAKRQITAGYFGGAIFVSDGPHDNLRLSSDHCLLLLFSYGYYLFIVNR